MKRTIKRTTPKEYSFLDLVAPSYNRLRITPKFDGGGPAQFNTTGPNMFMPPQNYTNNQQVNLNSPNAFDWNNQQMVDPGAIEWNKYKSEFPHLNLKDGSKEHQYFLCNLNPKLCGAQSPLTLALENSNDPEIKALKDKLLTVFTEDELNKKLQYGQIVKPGEIDYGATKLNRYADKSIADKITPEIQKAYEKLFYKGIELSGMKVVQDNNGNNVYQYSSPNQININQNTQLFNDQQSQDQQRLNNWNNRTVTQPDAPVGVQNYQSQMNPGLFSDPVPDYYNPNQESLFKTPSTNFASNILTETFNSSLTPAGFPRFGQPLDPRGVGPVGRPNITNPFATPLVSAPATAQVSTPTPVTPAAPIAPVTQAAPATTVQNAVQQPISNQPVTSQSASSDDEWIKRLLKYEETKGSPTGGALGNYGYNDWQILGNSKPPSSPEQALAYFKKDFLPNLSQYPMGMRERIGDFTFNTGRDYRTYMLDQYLKSIGQPGVPNRSIYNVDTKKPEWTPELKKSLDDLWNTYKNEINALPLDQQVSLLDKGRDSYYQSINRVNGQLSPSYNATWKGRLSLYDPVTPQQSTVQTPAVQTPAATQTPAVVTQTPAAVIQNPPATNTTQVQPVVKQYTPSNMLRASGDEDAEGSVSTFLNTNQNTQTTQQAPLGSNTGVTTNQNAGVTTNTSQQPIVNTNGATTQITTPNINTGTPSNMMRVAGYDEAPLVSVDPVNPPHGIDPFTGTDPYKVEWLKDAVRNQNTQLDEIKITPEKVEPKPDHYKPYNFNPFTTGLNILNAGLNTVGGMRNMGRMRNQENLNSFITQQPEAIYPNKRMLYGDKSMFAQYGGEYSEGGMYPEGGSVYQPEENIGALVQYKKGGIYIKPENKGKFTAWADAHGMSVQEAASHVMANKEKYSSTTVKRANFAKNASKFKHEKGGEIDNDKEMVDGVADILSRVNDLDNRKELARYMTNQFNDENVDYDYNQFLEATNLMEMAYGGMYSYGGHYIPQDVPYLAGKFVPNPIDLEILANGGMIKRADGTYSKRGLWDNIRANKGSGKKPTKEMLKQERKIKKGYKAGGEYMEGNEYEISGAELERLKSLGYDVEMI